VKKSLFIAAVVVFVALASGGIASGDLDNSTPVDDVWVAEGSPDTNKDGASLWVGDDGGTAESRSWLKFDISAIPSGSTINSATLYCHYVNRNLDPEVGVWQSDNIDWSETTLTWNTQPAIVGYGENYVVVNSADPWWSWNVTPIVENALNNNQENVTIVLRFRPGAYSTDYRVKFDNSEVGASVSPYLEVDYDPPQNTILIENITCDNTLIDNDVDWAGSGAVTTTRISAEVEWDNTQVSIDNVLFAIYDANDALVDNLPYIENEKIEDNRYRYYVVFDASDNTFADGDLGGFDVKVQVLDNEGDWTTGTESDVFRVVDLSLSSRTENVPGHRVKVIGEVSYVGVNFPTSTDYEPTLTELIDDYIGTANMDVVMLSNSSVYKDEYLEGESNIYDYNDTTYAASPINVGYPPGSTYIGLVWDLGEIKTFTVKYKHASHYDITSYLESSLDNVTYDNFSSVEGLAHDDSTWVFEEGTTTLTARYIRWRWVFGVGASSPRLYTLTLNKVWVENIYGVSGDGNFTINVTTQKLDGKVDNSYLFPNIPPEVVSISVDNSLIDNHKNYSDSPAVTATKITVRIRDNDNRDDLSDAWIAIRDAADALIDNENVWATRTVVDENTYDVTLVYDAEDNVLSASQLGSWDAWGYVSDIYGGENWIWDVGTFTVDEWGITINLSPDNSYMGFAYGFGITATGTISRVSGAASTVDNSWLRDENAGTFTLGADNTYSQSWTIGAPPGTENLYVRVWGYGGVLDGENYAYYDVNENHLYNIYVWYEDNFDLVPDGDNENAIENRSYHLTFYFNNRTEEFDLTSNPEEIVAHGQIPRKVRLYVQDENYWRIRILPETLWNGDIYFFVAADPGSLWMYEFTLKDLTGAYGSSENGQLWLSRYYGDNLMNIHEDYWDLEDTVTAFLMYGEEYRVRLVTPERERESTPVLADSVQAKDITVSQFELPDASMIWDYVYWATWWTAENYLKIAYQDNTEATDNVILTIYDDNGNVAYTSVYTSNEWALTWTSADPDVAYVVELEINHQIYGFSPIVSRMLPGVSWTPPISGPIPGISVIGDLPFAWGTAIAVFFSTLVLLTYGRKHAGFSVFVAGLLLIAMGPIMGIVSGIPAEVIALICVIGVMLMLAGRR